MIPSSTFCSFQEAVGSIAWGVPQMSLIYIDEVEFKKVKQPSTGEIFISDESPVSLTEGYKVLWLISVEADWAWIVYPMW